MARRSSLRRSWEMRWYRQHSRKLLGDKPSDLVPLPDEEVIDAGYHGDPCVRHRGPQLLRGPELVVLRRDDEGALRDFGQRARREVQAPSTDPDERHRIRRPAAGEIRE